MIMSGWTACWSTRPSLARQVKVSHMPKVKRINTPASDGWHPLLQAGSGKRRTRPQPRPAESPPAALVPRVRRLPIASDAPLRGPSSAMLVGEAGTSLVLCKLPALGIPAQLAMAGLPYDLIADIPGFDLVRIQVKTRSRPSDGQCSFKMKRGFYRSKSGVFAYTPEDFDIAAFACLSLSAIFFHPGPVGHISKPSDWLRLPGIDSETLSLAVQTLRRNRYNDACAWLASMSPDAPDPATPIADAPGAGPSGEQSEFHFGSGGC